MPVPFQQPLLKFACSCLLAPRAALRCSATTYSVSRSFCQTALALDKTFVISLLQPPPEVVQLFDYIMLLTDGRMVFQ